jgi:hypothetical protein
VGIVVGFQILAIVAVGMLFSLVGLADQGVGSCGGG